MNIGGGVSDWYRGVDLITSAPGGTVDQANAASPTGTSVGMSSYPGGSGQGVTFGDTPTEVSAVRMQIKNTSTPAPRGLVRAAFFALSGGVPTGAPLSVSDFHALDGLTTSGVDYYFNMSAWTPSADTAYGLAFQYFNAFNQTNGISYPSNSDVYSYGSLLTSTDYASAPTVAGSWSALSGTDLNFTVYSSGGSGTMPGGAGPDGVFSRTTLGSGLGL